MALKSFANGAIFGEQFGSGPPEVLAMHGWGRDRSDFARTLDGLNAVSIDLPGFGASPPPGRAVGAGWYAEKVIPIVQSFERPVILVGHSFGGRVAVMAAATRPELVAGVVFAGVPLLRRADRPPVRPPLGYRLVKAGHRLGILPARRLEEAKARYGSADYRAATGVMRDVLVILVNEEYVEELGSLQCPVAFVWGADDDEVPVSVAERAAALVPGHPGVTVVAGVGHHLPARRPDALRAAIEALA